SSRTAGCGFGCGVDVSFVPPSWVNPVEQKIFHHRFSAGFVGGFLVAHTVEVIADLVFSERVAAVDAPGPEGMVAVVTHGEFAEVEVVEPSGAVNHSTSSMNS